MIILYVMEGPGRKPAKSLPNWKISKHPTGFNEVLLTCLISYKIAFTAFELIYW